MRARHSILMLTMLVFGFLSLAGADVRHADLGQSPDDLILGDDESDDESSDDPGPEFGEFEDLTMSVVYSSSDEDAQILIAGGSEDPLKFVKAWGPGGIKPIAWKANDGNQLGHADFQFETPEPTLEGLMQAYPPGEYEFTGKTVSGELLAATYELSYDLLPAPVITYPMDGDSGVPVNFLIVTWDEIPGAEAIRFELEDEEEEVALKVDLAGDADSFEFPNNWLQCGTEYTLDIKAIGENGNNTVTDLRFTTEE